MRSLLLGKGVAHSSRGLNMTCRVQHAECKLVSVCNLWIKFKAYLGAGSINVAVLYSALPEKMCYTITAVATCNDSLFNRHTMTCIYDIYASQH